MNLKEKYEVFKNAKKGDLLKVVWTEEGKRNIEKRFDLKDDLITFEKLYCEVGKNEFNYKGEYIKTLWIKPITRERFFDEFYGTEQKEFCISMNFVIYANGKYIQVLSGDIEEISIHMTKKVLNAIDKAYDYCNINSKDDDCIYKAINKYKALREIDDTLKDEIYDILVKRLGF